MFRVGDGVVLAVRIIAAMLVAFLPARPLAQLAYELGREGVQAPPVKFVPDRGAAKQLISSWPS